MDKKQGLCWVRVALVAMCFVLPMQAQSQSQSPAMELELPDIHSNAFVRLADYAPKPMVINFWNSDCPPCAAELPILVQVASSTPEVQFLGVAVDDRIKASRFLSRLTIPYVQLLAPQNSDGIMRRFGDPKGILPYTVVLHKDRRICQTHIGAVDLAWVLSATRACAY